MPRMRFCKKKFTLSSSVPVPFTVHVTNDKQLEEQRTFNAEIFRVDSIQSIILGLEEGARNRRFGTLVGVVLILNGERIYIN